MLRRLAHDALRLIMRVLRPVQGRHPPDYFTVVPPPTNPEEVAEVYASLNWYLPTLGATMPVVVPETAAASPADAAWLEPDLVRRPPGLVSSPPQGGHEHLIIREVSPSSLLRSARALGRATVIDPNFFYGSDFRGFVKLRQLCSIGRPPTRGSEQALDALVELIGAATCMVLGTGPSATEVSQSDAAADVRIVCNSIVRNRDLLEALKPQVIAFGDPVFHFGPSRYAATFRRDMLHAAERYGSLIVVPSWEADLLLDAYPFLAGRVLPFEMTTGLAWRWVSRSDMRVRPTGNVLTEMMLPMAFAVADEVRIGGCDGRNPQETYFWKHNAATQYDDELMMSVFASHPAFFRDRDYKDYYDKHCADLEEFLQVAEQHGKRISSVTSTFIPALVRRQAGAT